MFDWNFQQLNQIPIGIHINIPYNSLVGVEGWIWRVKVRIIITLLLFTKHMQSLHTNDENNQTCAALSIL